MRDDSPGKKLSRSRSRSASNSSARSNLSKKSDRSRSRSRSSSRSRSRSRSADIDEYRLHIADIGDEIRKNDLEKVFSPYGELKEVWMTNSTPCFGFAVFKEKKAAAAALKACDGIEVAGCRIRVTYARPRTRGSGRRFYNSNMRCYQCGYTGHFYRDCPEMGGGDKRDRGYDRSRRYSGGGGGGRDRNRDYYGRDRDYDRDYDRRSSHRSSRRYDDYRSSTRRSSGGRDRRPRY